MTYRYYILAAFLVVALLGFENQARAEATERASATVFFATDFGLSTHKSQLVESNETGTSLTYELGVHAGLDRNMGMGIRNSMSTIAFELNETSMQSTSQDILLRYRMGPLFFGVNIAQAALIATLADTTEIDAVATGYGANAGLVADVDRTGYFFLDLYYNTYGATREANQIEMSIASKMELETGFVFYLTRDLVDGVVGYRYLTQTMSLDSNYSDTVTSTFIGLRLNKFF